MKGKKRERESEREGAEITMNKRWKIAERWISNKQTDIYQNANKTPTRRMADWNNLGSIQ